MSFTDIFGGTTVYASEVSYRAVALTANVALDWPTETAPTGDVLADILDVTPSSAGFTIRLPAANAASVGQTALFFNVGADSFVVADNGGNTVVTLSAGQAWQVYLIDNTTVNGVWRSYQYGAGTSVATAGSLIGAGIKAIGTTLNQAMSSTSLNTNYLAGDADRSEVFNWTGGAGTFSLPSAATVGNDWFVHLRNSGTGGLSIVTTVGGQNVNGSAALILNPGDSGILFSDGSNFFTIGLGKSASFAFDFVSISLTGQPSPYILAGANLNRVAYRFTGNITGNVQIVAPSTVQQYWVSNETDLASAPYTIEIKTLAGLGVTFSRNQRAILYCDGTDVIDADTAGISLPLSVSQGGTGSTTDSGARINLGATAVGNSLFTAVSASSARSTLGASAVGDAVFVADDAAAARAAIGAVNIAGDAITGGLTVAGNFGVGTLAPATKLEVRAASGSGGLVTLVNTTAFANTNVVETTYSLNNSATGLATAAAIGVVNPLAAANSYGDVYFKTRTPSGGLTEKMRLQSDGLVGIGTSVPNAQLVLSGAGAAAHVAGFRNTLYLKHTSPTSNQSNAIVFGSDGTASSVSILNDVNADGTTVNRLDITAGGSGGVFLASGATAWAAVSDERLKDEIEPIVGAVGRVCALRAVIGKYKTDSEGIRRSFLYAQDVQAVLPEAVTVGTDAAQTLGLAYSELIPLLVAAIKELSVENAALNGRIAAMEVL